MSHCEIHLTQGQVALVDVDDYERVAACKWCADWNRRQRVFYASRMGARKIKMHRFIVDAPEGLDVDHWNRNTLDNRKHNLRVCTRAENSWNQAVRRNNKCGFKGVYWRKDNGLWRAEITANGKKTNLGQFSTAEEAAAAYREAAKALHGEFARW